MKGKVAILDMGSTSIRLIILQINDNDSYKLIDQAKQMVRLAKGVDQSNQLHPKAMEKAISCLINFKNLAYGHGATKIIPIATAAIRKATNSADFLTMVKEQTGMTVSVISGKQEAYWSFLGTVNTIPLTDFILIDVGGGSTELVLVKKRQIQQIASLPMGAINLSQRFPLKNSHQQQPDPQLTLLMNHVSTELYQLSWLQETIGLPVVALGGTARTLAKIDGYRRHYPLKEIHNYLMKADTAQFLYHHLAQLSSAKRKKLKGLPKERADIIVSGLTPITSVLEITKASQLIISSNGLREGIFHEYYWQQLQQQPESIVPDALSHSLDNILKNYHVNLTHCKQVQKLALLLFDQLQELHQLDYSCRQALKAGAMLHQVGHIVNYYHHNTHSFYIILNSPLHGLFHREKVMAAFIASCHHNGRLKQMTKKYKSILLSDDSKKIRILSLFCLVASLLDRCQNSWVKHLDCHISKKEVRIQLQTDDDAVQELSQLESTKKPFKKLLGKKLTFDIC